MRVRHRWSVLIFGTFTLRIYLSNHRIFYAFPARLLMSWLRASWTIVVLFFRCVCLSNLRKISILFNCFLSSCFLCGGIFTPPPWRSFSPTPLVYFFPHGGCNFFHDRAVIDVQAVCSRLVAFLQAAPAFGKDESAAFQRVDRREQCFLAQAGAAVDDGTVVPADAAQHLAERDGVAVFAVAEGVADDVQEHLQLRARQIDHDVVDLLVGNLCITRALESSEWYIVSLSHNEISPSLDSHRRFCYALLVTDRAVSR